MYQGTLHKQKVGLIWSLMVCSVPKGWPIQKPRHMSSSPFLHASLSQKLHPFSSLIVIGYYLLLQLNISVSMMPVPSSSLHWHASLSIEYILTMPHSVGYYLSMCLTKWETYHSTASPNEKLILACLTWHKKCFYYHTKCKFAFPCASPNEIHYWYVTINIEQNCYNASINWILSIHVPHQMKKHYFTASPNETIILACLTWHKIVCITTPNANSHILMPHQMTYIIDMPH